MGPNTERESKDPPEGRAPGSVLPWGQVTATFFFAVAVLRLVVVHIRRPTLLGSDLVDGYLIGAQRFLDTGSPYTTEQLAGPWKLGFHDFIHPPSTLPLFVPFLWLPIILWWLLPLGITIMVLRRLRPAPWAWAVMAMLLCWPRSTGSILAGNTDMWVAAAVAAGVAWGWPAVGVALKPSFAPLALVGAHRRSTYGVAAIIGLLSIVMLPLWLQWWAVILNAHLNFAYSLLNLPLACIGVVAALGSDRVRLRAPLADRWPRIDRTFPWVHHG